MQFSEGLETIELSAFAKSGIESVVLPSSTKVISWEAFVGCKRLRNVQLNEGLKTLRTLESGCETVSEGGPFKESSVERVTIPSTLTKVGPSVFKGCNNLDRIEFLEGREVLGKDEKDASIWN